MPHVEKMEEFVSLHNSRLMIVIYAHPTIHKVDASSNSLFCYSYESNYTTTPFLFASLYIVMRLYRASCSARCLLKH